MPKINNKSNIKTSFIKKRFNLQSRKVQFFVVIGIFAILGGVYFTYKSFAASTTWAFSLSANNLKSSSNNQSTCKTTNVRDAAKNNSFVINIYCTNQAKGTDATVGIKEGLQANTAGYYRVCAYIKGVSPRLKIYITNGRAGRQSFNTFYDINRSDYGYYCTGYLYISGTQRIEGFVQVKSVDGTSWFNVGSMTIEKR